MSTATRAVSVAELRRAWQAVQDGQFRGRLPASRPAGAGRPAGVSDAAWHPATGEELCVVLGCTSQVGASTVALAIAHAAQGGTRLVECAPLRASGLVTACDAELGLDPSGWLRGSRDGLTIQRRSDTAHHPGRGPTPPATGSPLTTVLDAGAVWPVVEAGDWLAGVVRAASRLVVVARLSVPGLRRLEGCLERLGADRVVAAVVGPARGWWPRGVGCTVGALTGRVIEEGRLVCVPWDRRLALHGLTAQMLPWPVAAAGRELLELMEGSME